ncbi:MAG: trypsin-like peptidase domain-containing protein [Nitriliruptor sp.]
MSNTLPPPPPPPPPAAVASARPRRAVTTLLATAVAATVGAGVAVPVTLSLSERGGAAAGSQPVARTVAGEAPLPVGDIAADVSPSVAAVRVSGPRGQGAGSAVIYRADGYLVTNAHVVASGGDVSITLPDGTSMPAEVVGADETSDLAVLHVDADSLPVPTYAEAAPKVGDTSVAIGSPFGLDGSVTTGIVSALGRSVSTPGVPLVDMIQTDAAINPGNSGGALVDAAGRIIGINTAILSPSGANNGIGFAIPVATVHSVAEQLITTGTVEHAYLGVQGVTVDPTVTRRYDLAEDVREGVVLVDVESASPAEAAGLREGDTIVAVDGERVASMEELAGRIRRSEVGASVPIEVVRDGDRLELETTLTERPSSPAR